ncbi:hypothetical protein LEP1GSC036_4030 [Leptospira weilii str. 2006001853]|uniref:Uncharacterized protein n=2 Tax=Leptospira weilii TaxID=28184 RepID=A0A828Z665_9LEPT|nr:hypothetical protein LEP1GSC036_4030 [Leptospira weilii str. 2006001853]EMM72873.1 hypothetical protein LEP1GSC038_3576 [Leptospira weilii str. 2006001855]
MKMKYIYRNISIRIHTPYITITGNSKFSLKNIRIEYGVFTQTECKNGYEKE